MIARTVFGLLAVVFVSPYAAVLADAIWWTLTDTSLTGC